MQNYRAAEQASWFTHSLLPPNLQLPLQGAEGSGWRNFACYDPAPTLPHVTTPTLALYGAEDRAVDAPHAMQTLRADFKEAGMTDLTILSYPGAAHTLELSPNGFVPSMPVRYAPGYPGIMIEWLARRGFVN